MDCHLNRGVDVTCLSAGKAENMVCIALVLSCLPTHLCRVVEMGSMDVGPLVVLWPGRTC